MTGQLWKQDSNTLSRHKNKEKINLDFEIEVSKYKHTKNDREYK